MKYRIVPLEWWSNGTTLQNLHAHVQLKGKLSPFAFHSRCTSAHGANPSPACVSRSPKLRIVHLYTQDVHLAVHQLSA